MELVYAIGSFKAVQTGFLRKITLILTNLFPQ